MRKIVPIILLFLVSSYAGHAQENDQNPDPNSMVLKVSGEYMAPTRNGNPIRTFSAHSFFWKKRLKEATFYLKAGITTTYAWGHSRQWYHLHDNVWQAYDYETAAFGIGPVIQIEHPMIRTKYFDLMAEASAGCIRYNTHFPYGGDVYDFMLRTGPSIAFKANKNYSFELGYRWMHVSNGQGSGNQNPFYEAHGATLSINFRK